jgi:integrase
MRVRRPHAQKAALKMSPYITILDFENSTDAKARQRAIKFVSRRMARVLKLASLPEHHTPHCLRHTFASVLIAAGISPGYVQRQLGHSSIALTVNVYRRWLPIEVPGAVDRLDGCVTGSTGKEVAENGKVESVASL